MAVRGTVYGGEGAPKRKVTLGARGSGRWRGGGPRRRLAARGRPEPEARQVSRMPRGSLYRGLKKRPLATLYFAGESLALRAEEQTRARLLDCAVDSATLRVYAQHVRSLVTWAEAEASKGATLDCLLAEYFGGT